MTQEEIQNTLLESLPENPQGRYLLSPRFGKTRFVLKIFDKYSSDISVLWVTPFAKLKEQIVREFIDFGREDLTKNLTVSTWASLSKQVGYYDFIILDEEQFISVNNSKTLVSEELKANCIISMTGTATKDKDKLEIYQKLGLSIVCDYSINQAVDDGVLSDYEVKVLNLTYDKKDGYINQLERQLKPLGTYHVEGNKLWFKGNLEGFVVCADLRMSKKGNLLHRLFNKNGQSIGYLMENKLIGKATIQGVEYFLKDGHYSLGDVNVLSLYNRIKEYKQKFFAAKAVLNNVKGKSLVFCSSIQQAENLCDFTYHSKKDDTDFKRFLNDEIDKIALVNIGSVGSNFLNLSNLLLLQCDSDKNGRSSQKITRILLKEVDKKPVIWLFCLKGTQDEKWVQATLESFDKTKIKYLEL